MSADFHSSNPFRRKAATNMLDSSETSPSHSNDAAPSPPFPFLTSTSYTAEPLKIQTKSIKKVRVQSPPPSSPEAEPIPQIPPTPIPRDNHDPNVHSDPFDNAHSDTSGDETETLKNYPPVNPFQKTLATMEHTDVEPSNMPASADSRGFAGAGRGSLDVEAFKRLLMTGSAEAVVSRSTTMPHIHIGHVEPIEGSSSTDASSAASKLSVFDPIQEIHPESPRTSHELSDLDDERQISGTAGFTYHEKKRPPPPSSRHGKLIKVELKDEGLPASEFSPSADGRGLQQLSNRPPSTNSIRSPTDLNKPLPAAPTRASHESDRESVFDREAAGKTPEPPSPSSSMRRKTAPAPPLTRRHSQLVSESKLNRTPTGRLSPNVEEDGMIMAAQGNTVTQSNIAKPPPPPPARRPASIRNSSRTDSLPSPALSSSHDQEKPITKSASGPAPPPARLPSNRHSSRPSSVLSMETATSKRASNIAPPPPPPPRQRASSKTSVEMQVLSSTSSKRDSGDYLRKSIDAATADYVAAPVGQSDAPGDKFGANNILADLNALQREVDALRGQYEKKDGS